MKKTVNQKKSGSPIYVAFCILLGSVALVGALYYFGYFQRNDVVKIGFVGALSGGSATFGIEAKRIVEIAVDEVNQAGGIGGKTLEVIYEDSECDGPAALKVAEKLVKKDNVLAIIGASCSGEVLSMRHVTEEAGVVLLTSSATSPEISDIGTHIFRNVPSDTASGLLLAEMAFRSGTSTFMINENTDYARAIISVAEKEYKKFGGKDATRIGFDVGTSDFSSIVSRVLSKNPSSIIISPQNERVSIQLISQLRMDGYSGGIYSLTEALTQQEIADDAGKYLNGVEIVGFADLDRDNPKAAHLIDLFVPKYGEMSYEYFGGATYDSVLMMADALRSAEPSRESVYDYLKNLKSYSGAIGAYGFDETGDVTGISFIKKMIKDGKVIIE